MSVWAHLPNAPHIDRVLEHAAKKPTRWDATLDVAWSDARSTARNAAWSAARGSVSSAAQDAVWSATWDAARGATRVAARGAVSALIAWDDCAYLLDLTPETVRGIARMSNSPAAILLLPAVIALQPEGA